MGDFLLPGKKNHAERTKREKSHKEFKKKNLLLHSFESNTVSILRSRKAIYILHFNTETVNQTNSEDQSNSITPYSSFLYFIFFISFFILIYFFPSFLFNFLFLILILFPLFFYATGCGASNLSIWSG